MKVVNRSFVNVAVDKVGDKMDTECSMHWKEEELIQSLGGKARRKEASRKT
jgi:hypothetical protein